MSYTEPTPITGYVEATLQTKPGLLSYVTFPEKERNGKQFDFFIAERPAVSEVTCDDLPPDKNNVTRSVTVTDMATFTCFTQSELNSFNRMPGARVAMAQAHAEALLIDLEVALDAVLATSTNTIALATDNTWTLTEFMRGIAQLQMYGVPLDEMVFVTASALGLATIFNAGMQAAGGTQGDARWGKNVIGTLMGVPIVADANFSNSTSTGGTAGYLWGRSGVVAGYDNLEVHDPTFIPQKGAYGLVGMISHGFTLTDGVAGKRVVKFINP